MGDELFWKEKLKEQQESFYCETHQLRQSLIELRLCFNKINELKRHFINEHGKYYSLLNMWKDKLDQIFVITEKEKLL